VSSGPVSVSNLHAAINPDEVAVTVLHVELRDHHVGPVHVLILSSFVLDGAVKVKTNACLDGHDYLKRGRLKLIKLQEVANCTQITQVPYGP
jgi:hypothetical protein